MRMGVRLVIILLCEYFSLYLEWCELNAENRSKIVNILSEK